MKKSNNIDPVALAEEHERLTRIGQNVADLLGLAKGTYGYYAFSTGCKTDVGLARTVLRAVEDADPTRTANLNEPKTLSTAAAQAKVLNKQDGIFLRWGNGSRTFYDLSEWEFIPDVKYLDRLWLCSKGEPSNREDVSHTQIFTSGELPLWEPIDVPPAYLAVPAGETMSTEVIYDLGARVVTTQDLRYYQGDLILKGAVLEMAGYKTERLSRFPYYAFAPCFRFPDGTYRDLPYGKVKEFVQ